MRMWMVDPRILCRNHLLGEHNELHKLVGAIKKKKSLFGYISQNIIETKSIALRHKVLAQELQRRNYNHNSPLEYTDTLDQGTVNPASSLKDLLNRCRRCQERYETYNCKEFQYSSD